MAENDLCGSLERLELGDGAQESRARQPGGSPHVKTTSLRRGAAIPPPETLLNQSNSSNRGHRGRPGSARGRGYRNRGGGRPSPGSSRSNATADGASKDGMNAPKTASGSATSNTVTTRIRPSPLRNATTAETPPGPTTESHSSTNTAVYVVQVVSPPRKVLAVFSNLAAANASAVSYMSMVEGVPADAISSNLGIFGQVVKPAAKLVTGFTGKTTAAPAPTAQAGKRTFPDGTLQIVDTAGRPWLQVARIEVSIDEDVTTEGENVGQGENPVPPVVYLAHDSEDIVVGAYSDKGAAWEGCKRYVHKLTYWDRVQDLKQWAAEDGMYHATGKVLGTGHHWFVKRWAVTPSWDAPTS